MTQPPPVAAAEERTVWARHLQTPLRQFVATETGSAVVLLAATIGALVWSNVSPSSYETVWHTRPGTTSPSGSPAVHDDLRDLSTMSRDTT